MSDTKHNPPAFNDDLSKALSEAAVLLRQRLTDYDDRPETLMNMRLIKALSNRMSDGFNQLLTEYGINESLYFALLMLYRDSGTGLAPVALARLLNLTRTSAKRLSDDLLARGWAIRSPSPTDRRSFLLYPTEAGRAQVEDIAPRMAAIRAVLWQDFCQEDVLFMQDLLNQLLLRVQALPITPVDHLSADTEKDA